MTIDGLSFLGASLFGTGDAPDALVRRMDELDIAVTVVAPCRPPDYHLPPANAWLAEVARHADGRLVGLGRIDPNRPDAVRHAEEALGGLGLRGLFLHPREEVFGIDGPGVDAVVEVAAAHGRPVVVSAGWPWLAEALQVAELARRHREVRFVMTNGGQFNISGLGQFDAELALRRCPNLLVQTSGVYRQDFIERAVAELGAQRVVFASGSPVFSATYELLRVQLAEVASEADRELILEGNAASLFGLAP